jgi:hypothetical protein
VGLFGLNSRLHNFFLSGISPKRPGYTTFGHAVEAVSFGSGDVSKKNPSHGQQVEFSVVYF